jgi:tripartite-type tricarboxylate transporter receptor subunit TctC
MKRPRKRGTQKTSQAHSQVTPHRGQGEKAMLRILVIVAAMLGAASVGRAETDFPTKTVTIVVPFAPGGPSDQAARILADELMKVWKQQVVIENKPGVGTVNGALAVHKSVPDGYTWACVSGSFVINAAVRKNLPYNTLKDFVGVSVFIEGPLGIVAHLGFPANNLAELIELAKQRADKPLTFASAGIGSPVHMGSQLVQKKAGIKLVHIPYNGEAAAIPDVLSGRVDFQIGTWVIQRPYVESGKLKMLAALFKNRLPEAPNVPTAAETIKDLGLPLSAWNGIAVSSQVPKDVLAKISAGIKTATSTKTFEERIRSLGSYPAFTTLEETDAYLKREISTWSDVAASANIRLD